MKVILVQDVDKLGEIGDVVDVADGYGRNYLLPRGYAVAATARNKRQLEHEQRLREHRITRARKDAETFAGTLQEVPCHFVRKAGEEGRLFGSVTVMDIAEKLKEAGLTSIGVVFNSISQLRAWANLRCQCGYARMWRRC
jgi:large subunit ribosomal protein L9